MNVERRGHVRQPYPVSNCQAGGDTAVKAKPFVIEKRDVYRAWLLVKTNQGAAGVDGQTLADFESSLKDNLYKLWNRLSSGSYYPPPVKGVAIPKKSGGERLLGIPTVADRVAQMVVRLHFEPLVEPHFLPDSYGYRPNKSAIDAIRVTRQRCWQQDWVLEFDIKGLFDHIPHDLLMKAVRKHTNSPWICLYIERWLTAQMECHGEVLFREKGTPQGGVISPILANLFLHYVFDKWMQKYYPRMKWCRYADDGLVHCQSEAQAREIWQMLEHRFRECGLLLHPDKTRIAYCKDVERKGKYEQTSFDFLGYTFRPRLVKNRKRNSLFVSFTPAVSKAAQKAMRFKIRKLKIRMRTELNLIQMANWLNPMINGWLNYYGQFCRSELYKVFRQLNKALVRWVRRKFKALSRHKTQASKLLQRIAKEHKGLFAHWRAGMTGVFA
ncbi:group II intron reverse transcriptase/maturase [Photorhabdus heterorhabditis]|uniref:Group II intron reverse transcriptase/maturase n=2 Tax=Photorhabdus TaxID=29487 RepID=A0A5B0W908_9GAMM|nr:group II intron reverse transcriptase/maturase [Photorhabdus heterorhabditis]KAA1183192.1 group II intron reverse transcriptase/maturase [Photorhabdus heterorhabditis]